MIKKLMLIALIPMALGSCGKGAVQCSAESARTTAIEAAKDTLEKRTSASIRSSDGDVSMSKVRAAISQLVFAIDDMRTSKEDPDSTKRFCIGTLKVTFPTETLDDANQAREAANLKDVSALADSSDVKQNADSFSTEVEFNVQPTDAGDKVFVAFEGASGTNLIDFAAEVLASGLLRSSVEDSQRQQRLAQDQQSANQEAALSEQRAANIGAAQVENKLAVQTITALWKGLLPETRARLLPLQRAWIRKKDADCKVEAASASVDTTEMEVARLGCDTRSTQERVGQLQRYRENEPESDESENMM